MKIRIVTSGAALAAALTLPAAAQTPAASPSPAPATSIRGSLELGFWNSSLTGSPDLVSEFDPADVSRPLGALRLESTTDWGHVALDAQGHDKNAQSHSLRFDAGRSVRTFTTYTRFLARQGHDPLDNLAAATAQGGRVVRHTDLDPGAVYQHSHALFEHRTEIQPEAIPALTLGVELRDQRRNGAHQALAVSHCDTCHVYSQTHRIGERLSEGGLDARFNWRTGFVKAALSHRRLRQDVPAVSLRYDRALQPELRTPIFDNRVQFDALEGPQLVDHLQDVNKTSGRLDLRLQDVLGFRVGAGGVWSTTQNRFTSLEADYKGYAFQATRPLANKKLFLRWRGRAYALRSDDVFVDTRERAGSAGPHAGRTYRQVYGFDPDFTRRSTTSRDVYESDAEASYKLGRKAGTLRASWRFGSVDRLNYEVAPGETTTTTHVLGLAWRPSLARHVKLSADWRHGSVDNPLVLINGACSTLVSPGPLASPFDPRAAQYYQFQDARVAETTAVPESWDELRLNAGYARSKVGLHASWRWWDGTNRAGDLTDWSKTTHLVTATLSLTPSPRWDAYLAYSFQKAELGAHTCIALFDG
jgi:hypothetical protein